MSYDYERPIPENPSVISTAIPEEDVAENMERFSHACRKICRSYQRGRMSHDELHRLLSSELCDGFLNFLHRHDVHMHITPENWPDFMNDYHLWSEGELPTTGNPLPWFRFYLDGSDASAQDKATFFRLMRECCISPKYYQPLAEGYADPDLLPGHFPVDYIVGMGHIWEDDGGLLSDDFKLGDTIILTDHYGLKSEIKVTERVPEEDIRRRGSYVGTGYIEGYTSKEKPHKIHISIDNRKIYALSFSLDPGEELEVYHFPLWDEWNKWREKREKCFQSAVDQIEEKYSIVE